MNRLSISGSLAISQGYILIIFIWVSSLLLLLNLECGCPHVLQLLFFYSYFLNYPKALKRTVRFCFESKNISFCGLIS